VPYPKASAIARLNPGFATNARNHQNTGSQGILRPQWGVMDCAAPTFHFDGGTVECVGETAAAVIARPHGFRTESIENRTDLH
jgi:hypothetical protein